MSVGRTCALRSSDRCWPRRQRPASSRRSWPGWPRGSGSIRSPASRCVSPSRRSSAGTTKPGTARIQWPSCAAKSAATAAGSRPSPSSSARRCGASMRPIRAGATSCTSTIWPSSPPSSRAGVRCPPTPACGATWWRTAGCGAGAGRAASARESNWPRSAARRARRAATRPSTRAASGTSTSITAR